MRIEQAGDGQPRFWAKASSAGWLVYDHSQGDRYMAYVNRWLRVEWHHQDYWGTDVQQWLEAVRNSVDL